MLYVIVCLRRCGVIIFGLLILMIWLSLVWFYVWRCCWRCIGWIFWFVIFVCLMIVFLWCCLNDVIVILLVLMVCLVCWWMILIGDCVVFLFMGSFIFGVRLCGVFVGLCICDFCRVVFLRIWLFFYGWFCIFWGICILWKFGLYIGSVRVVFCCFWMWSGLMIGFVCWMVMLMNCFCWVMM